MTANLRDQLQATLSGSYTLERELGGGGMSRVFLAEETQLNRKVVVKVLSTELAAEISAERFQREIKTAASLQQANIVPVLTAGNAGGVPYFTMPFVEGESLRARLGRTGALSITEAVKVMGDIARALAYAHQRGIVHRDIKPDNVLLSGGTAVVTDFGIAKAITAARTGGGSQSPTLTQLGTALGTPAYMAPEQAAGDPSTDHRADFYAFGCTAYELLTGRPPFVDKTPQRLLAAHMSLAPDAIGTLRADIPGALADLVMRCLEKDAPRRPATATEIIAALDAVSTTSGSGQPAMPAVLLGGPAMFRKALAIYAAAIVVVAILSRAAIVGIGLPEWVFAGSLIVMALGLPVILWTGYVQRVARRAATMTPTFTPGGTPTTAHGTIATMALRAAPKMSWYRTARGGMYALGSFVALVGVAMAMRAADIGPFATLRGQLGNGSSLILTDFRTSNTDSTLGRVVSDAIRAGLAGSKVFTVTPQSAINAALTRMQRPPTTRIDSAVAREIALRDGLKAIVDGEITGVTGGYIVAVRLIRADSGIELASFRETGDGPRGLIDAADKLARALRSKAGESLREVNGTPALAQATTASLEALRKYSESARANSAGDRAAVQLAREAVALDSTFATGWSSLAAMISNWGGSRSAQDSAMTQAYRYRDRLPARERELVTARYYYLGPGRDRAKAAAAYQSLIDQGDSTTATINLGEVLRSRREYARAESLNLISRRFNPNNVISIGNTYEMQVHQGKMKEAEETLAMWSAMSRTNVMSRRLGMHFIKGEYEAQRRLADSLAKSTDANTRQNGANNLSNLALLGGQLKERARLRNIPGLIPTRVGGIAGEAIIEAALRGPSPALVTRLDSAVAATKFADIPQVDRQYLGIATAYARLGKPAQANAMIARYRAEMTDTSLRRVQEPDLQNVMAEIAIAEGKPMDAVAAFRRGDIGSDGFPANECSLCLPLNLARAYDAAAQPDSAIANFERYLSTPFGARGATALDPLNAPLIRERLGQLYEAKGNAEKAAEHYRAFIELWKNADPELQPRVKAAQERLAKLSPVERPRR
jgi:tetratricopeptide (TPR) repeat protein